MKHGFNPVCEELGGINLGVGYWKIGDQTRLIAFDMASRKMIANVVDINCGQGVNVADDITIRAYCQHVGTVTVHGNDVVLPTEVSPA